MLLRRRSTYIIPEACIVSLTKLAVKWKRIMREASLVQILSELLLALQTTSVHSFNNSNNSPNENFRVARSPMSGRSCHYPSQIRINVDMHMQGSCHVPLPSGGAAAEFLEPRLETIQAIEGVRHETIKYPLCLSTILSPVKLISIYPTCAVFPSLSACPPSEFAESRPETQGPLLKRPPRPRYLATRS